MAESLRIPATKAPTFLNRTGAAGLGLGIALGLGPLYALIPAVIGAYMGHSEMQADIMQGKTVEKPGLFKKEAFKDGLIGAGIASLAVGLLAIAGIIAVGGISGLLGSGAGLVVGAATVLTILAAPVIGFFIGASHGKKRMASEWAQAESYVLDRGEYRSPEQAQSRSRAPSRAPEVSYKNSVSAAEEQELETRMRANQKDFASLRLEEKLNAVDAEASR